MSAMERYFGDPLALIPYGILAGAALLLLIGSFGRAQKESRVIRLLVGLLAILGAGLSLLILPALQSPEGGFFIHDTIGLGFALTFLFLLLLVFPTLPLSTVSLKGRPSAILSLWLLSACGGLWMIFSDHLLFFFLGLELLSLPLYVLCGLGSDTAKGREAAFKYFILGAISAAFFVMGMALYWGGTGTLMISEMSRMSALSTFGPPGLATLGGVFMFVAVAFKLGAAPFQMWVPDVYEGAPASLVSWMAGGVKAAAVVVALRLFGQSYVFQTGLWTTVVTWVAILSMLWGSFGALPQTNVKRMLGYSAIAHAGYILVAIVCASSGAYVEAGLSLAFYLLVYGLASMIAFLVISLEESDGRTGIWDLAGLAVRKPAVAFAFAVALLSLAGLPPLGGFIGKFNVFLLAAEQGHYGLVIVGVATSVVSLTYYLRLIVSVYMEKQTHQGPLRVTTAMGIVLGVAVGITILLGLFPAPVLSFFLQGL